MTELLRHSGDLGKEVEGEITGSSGPNSLSSLGLSSNLEEVEEGEEVNQGEDLAPTKVVAFATAIVAPALIKSSDFEVADDLGFLSVQVAVGYKIEHSFIEGGRGA